MAAKDSLDATKATLTAIQSALLSDSGLQQLTAGAIFTAPPSNTKAPFVTITVASIADWSTSSEDGQAFTIDVHAWDQSQGGAPNVRPTYDALERIRSILHFATLTLDAPFHAVLCMVATQVAPIIENDGSTIHGIVTVRVIVDHT
jgi:hypothetical protein